MTPRDMAKRPEYVRKLMVAAMTPEERDAYEESLKEKPEEVEWAVPVEEGK